MFTVQLPPAFLRSPLVNESYFSSQVEPNPDSGAGRIGIGGPELRTVGRERFVDEEQFVAVDTTP